MARVALGTVLLVAGMLWIGFVLVTLGPVFTSDVAEEGSTRLRHAVVPFEGRGERFPSQALRQHLRDGRGRVAHLHVRKAGGGELRRMMIESGLYSPEGNSCELGNSAFDPTDCFHSDTIYLTSIRDPVSRFESDFNWEGPFGSENNGASKWEERLGIATEEWETAGEELFRQWMRWPASMEELDSVGVGMRPRGVYIPNFATMLLGADYQLSTSGGFRTPVGTNGFNCNLKPCEAKKLKRITDREEMERVLHNAKRTIVSLDLALPVDQLGNHIPFFEYVTAKTGREIKAGVSVHSNAHKVHFPEVIREEILADNWADQELYEFTKRLYEEDMANDFFIGDDGDR